MNLLVAAKAACDPVGHRWQPTPLWWNNCQEGPRLFVHQAQAQGRLAPTQTQVADFLRNHRRAIYKGKTEEDLLFEIRSRHEENIYYWEFREDENKNELHFTMTISSPILKKALFLYGQNVFGLDAVWKYTDHRIPVWLVVVNSPLGALPVGYVISTEGDGDTLRDALELLLADNTTALGMIDHDATEKYALTSLNVSTNTKID